MASDFPWCWWSPRSCWLSPKWWVWVTAATHWLASPHSILKMPRFSRLGTMIICSDGVSNHWLIPLLIGCLNAGSIPQVCLQSLKYRSCLVVVLPCNSNEAFACHIRLSIIYRYSYIYIYMYTHIHIQLGDPILLFVRTAMGRYDWLIDPNRMGLQEGSPLVKLAARASSFSRIGKDTLHRLFWN